MLPSYLDRHISHQKTEEDPENYGRASIESQSYLLQPVRVLICRCL